MKNKAISKIVFYYLIAVVPLILSLDDFIRTCIGYFSSIYCRNSPLFRLSSNLISEEGSYFIFFLLLPWVVLIINAFYHKHSDNGKRTPLEITALIILYIYIFWLVYPFFTIAMESGAASWYPGITLVMLALLIVDTTKFIQSLKKVKIQPLQQKIEDK